MWHWSSPNMVKTSPQAEWVTWWKTQSRHQTSLFRLTCDATWQYSKSGAWHGVGDQLASEMSWPTFPKMVKGRGANQLGYCCANRLFWVFHFAAELSVSFGLLHQHTLMTSSLLWLSSDPPCSGATRWRPLHHWRPQSWPQTWGWLSRSCCPMSSARCGCHRSIGQLSHPGQRRDGTYWSSQPSGTLWTDCWEKEEVVNAWHSSERKAGCHCWDRPVTEANKTSQT